MSINPSTDDEAIDMERLRDRLVIQETTLDDSTVDIPERDDGENLFFTEDTHRILDRSAPFRQSSGTMNIRRKLPASAKSAYLRSYYHSAVNMPTWRLLMTIVLLYLSTVVVYAGFYYSLGPSCSLGISFLDSLYLSVETMSTIGFGAPDIFFGGCKSAFWVIFAQYMTALTYDACCIGVILCRISRPTRRATSVIVSDKASMVKIRGQYHFMVQVAEIRQHQLLECHVRMYAIRHVRNHRGMVSQFQTQYMRLLHPNDEWGSMLLLALPSMCVHRVDAWSPLLPPEFGPRPEGQSILNSYRFPEVFQRSLDYEVGNRGLPDGTDQGDKTQADYQRQRRDVAGNRYELDVEEIKKYWRDCRMEVLVVVEGIDATTSSNTQKRHSFTIDDIAWNKTFAPCVREDGSGRCIVDMTKFHDMVPIDAHDEEDMRPVVAMS